MASDQWLLTTFDVSWKVSELKQYVLSKVTGKDGGGQQYFPPRNRPVSPITFASSGPSRHSLDHPADVMDEEEEEEEENDDDVFLIDGRHPRLNRSDRDRERAPSPPPTHHHSLIAFSTGQLLEDDYSLSWYRLHSNELLELHPPGAIISLSRDGMSEYIRPYIELKVKALRVVSHEDSKPAGMDGAKIRRTRDAGGHPRSPTERAAPSLRKRKKTKLEWKERWLIVHHGVLNLYRNKNDSAPAHSCALDSLSTLGSPNSVLRGPDASLPSPHVICAKFRPNELEAPLSPVLDSWTDPWTSSPIKQNAGLERRSKEDIKVRKGSSGGVGRSTEGGAEVREKGSYWYDADSDQDGTWLILDALEEKGA